jgi:hypothetical protein
VNRSHCVHASKCEAQAVWHILNDRVGPPARHPASRPLLLPKQVPLAADPPAATHPVPGQRPPMAGQSSQSYECMC